MHAYVNYKLYIQYIKYVYAEMLGREACCLSGFNFKLNYVFNWYIFCIYTHNEFTLMLSGHCPVKILECKQAYEA